MHIGQVARTTGLTMDTIRFYERQGLLPRPPRSAGNFRLYGETDLGTLHFIRRVHGLGFSLKEVRELAALRSSNAHSCSSVRNLLAAKLVQVRARIRELRELQGSLRASMRKCDRELKRRRKPSSPCPVLADQCNGSKGSS